MTPKDLTTFRFDSMEKAISEIKNMLSDHIRDSKEESLKTQEKIDNIKKESDATYSGKWVEKMMIWAAGVAGSGIIAGVLWMAYRLIQTVK
jgi:hypothetical protein